jgi:hypothetical protein
MAKKIKIRRLKTGGLAYLKDCIKKNKLPPESLINDAKYTEPTCFKNCKIDMEKKFVHRVECVSYIHKQIDSEYKKQKDEYLDDIGFWSWLALVYIKQLTTYKTIGDQLIATYDDANLIYNRDNWGKVRRHAIRNLYLLIDEFGANNCDLFIGFPGGSLRIPTMSSRGNTTEQVSQRYWLLQKKNAMNLIFDLYIDKSTRLPIIRAAGGGKASIERFGSVIRQISFTHDIDSMNMNELHTLIGPEFSHL